MGRHPVGLPGGATRDLERLGPSAGTLEMEGPVRVVGEILARGDGVGDAAVPAPPVRLREPVVDGVADERMTERETPRLDRRHEDLVVGELGDGSGQLRVVGTRRSLHIDQARCHGTEHRGEERDVERSPDDRRGAGDPDGRRGARRQTRPDQGAERVRGAGGRDRITLAEGRVAAVGQDTQQLLDMERDAIRADLDRVGDVLGDRTRGPRDGRDHRRGLLRLEATQAQLLGESLGDQASAPLAHRDPRVELVASEGPDDQHRQVARSAGQRAQDLQGQVVRPMQVLQPEQDRTRRCRAGEQVGQVQDEGATPTMSVAGPVELGQARVESVPEVGEDRGPPQGPGEVEE
jgi:hypothetical protein